jgi:hypothetical protein
MGGGGWGGIGARLNILLVPVNIAVDLLGRKIPATCETFLFKKRIGHTKCF